MILLTNLGLLGMNIFVEVDTNMGDVATRIGRRSQQMIYDLENLANQIHEDNVVKELYWKSLEQTEGGIVEDIKTKYHDIEYQITQKVYMLQQKIKTWKEYALSSFGSSFFKK